MATTPLSTNLQLQFQVGVGTNGRPKLKNHSFARISPNASDADVLAVGQALANLFGDTLYQIVRVNQSSLA